MITIPHELAAQIQRQAAEVYPEECCGILIGTENNDSRSVISLYEAQNIHSDNRARRFMISPDDYKKAEESARENNAEIIGFYHSHPDHPAVPSEHDREYAWPWFLYIIVSVRNGKPDAMEGWILRDDRSGYEKVHITIS